MLLMLIRRTVLMLRGGGPGVFGASLTPNPETLKTPKTLDNTYSLC